MKYHIKYIPAVLCLVLLLSGCSTGKGPDRNTADVPAVSADDTAPSEEALPTPEPTEEPAPSPEPSPVAEDITLAFAGDILLADGSVPMNAYYNRDKGLPGIFSEDLIRMMTESDIMMLNNEFSFSERGSAIAGKQYTFRANPSKVDIFRDMGVDVVSLANNHALDYGTDALMDTFDTLDEAGIDYIGAGAELERAKKVIYKEVKGRTIAYVGAAKTIYDASWIATDSRPGMISCWNEEMVKDMIREARENADYVVVYVHWGVEQNEYPEEYQKNWAHMYIDEGADIVLGCHPHVIQGMEIYNGKPIVYSLGNYWFSSYKRESMLIKVIFRGDGRADTILVPCMTGDCYTYNIDDAQEKEKYFNKMKKLSFGVDIMDNGRVVPLEETEGTQ